MDDQQVQDQQVPDFEREVYDGFLQGHGLPGLGDDQVDSEPAEPVADPAAAQPEPEPAPGYEARQWRKREREAREAAERRAAEVERENQQMRAALAAHLAQQQQSTEKPDPEPDFYEDQKAWHEWRSRQTEKALLAQMAPVTHQVQAQQQRTLAEQQALERQRQSVAEAQQRVTYYQDLADEYEESPEGRGHQARSRAWATAVMNQLTSRGVPPEVAQRQVAITMLHQLDLGRQLGYNPVQYLDDQFRALGIQGQAQPQPAPTPARQTQPQPPRRVDPSSEGVGGSLGSIPGNGKAGKSAVTVPANTRQLQDHLRAAAAQNRDPQAELMRVMDNLFRPR